MKRLLIFISAVLVLSLSTQISKAQNKHEASVNVSEGIFPKGTKGPAQFFTGNAYNTGLVGWYGFNLYDFSW